MDIKVYQGYGGGIPVYTIHGEHIYDGYGGGIPLYTLG